MPVSAAVQKSLSKDIPDAELAGRNASGDHVAFAVLMRKYNRMLYRTARVILCQVLGEDSVPAACVQ